MAVGNDRDMNLSAVEIRSAHDADLDRSAEVLGQAFTEYPWTQWTVDADNHVRRITELQRLALQHYGLAHGQVWVALVAGTIQSVAVWMDSRVEVPETVHRQLHPRMSELEGSRHRASVTAGNELHGWRPMSRHYYLATVGTAPAVQRQGLGARVLAPVLAAADSEGVGAFLETSSAANVAYYATLGFEVVGHRVIDGGGPDVWAMLRQRGQPGQKPGQKPETACGV